MPKGLKIKVLLLIYILSPLWLKTYAQPEYKLGLPYVKNYFNPERKITGRPVFKLEELPNGLILGATPDGITVFDGDTWSMFVQGHFTTLNYDHYNGVLYAGTVKDFGIIKYDQALQTFKYEPISHLSPRIIKNTWKICSSHYGVFFLVNKKDIFKYTYEGLHYLDLQGFAAQHCFKLPDDKIIVIDDSTGIGIISQEGFVLYSTSHKDIYKQSIVSFIPNGQNGHFLVITRTGNLYEYNIIKDEFKLLKSINFLKNSIPRKAVRLKDGNIAVMTGSGGLFVIDTKGNEILNLNYSNGLRTNSLIDIFVSDDGSIWVGSSRFVSRIFYSIPYRYANENLGFLGDISDFTIFHDTLLIGTTAGIYQANTKTKKFYRLDKNCTVDKGNFLHIRQNNQDYLLIACRRKIGLIDQNLNLKILHRTYQLYGLNKDSSGNIYAFSNDSLLIFNLEKNLHLVEKHSFYLPYIIDESVMANDSTMFVYSSGFNQLLKLKFNPNKTEISLNNIHTGDIKQIYKLLTFEDSLLFMLSDKGIRVYNYKTEEFIPNCFGNLNKSLVNKKVRDILFVENGIWALTDKNLIYYDLEKQKLTAFPIQCKAKFYSKKLVKWHNTLVGANLYSLFFISEKDLIKFSNQAVEKPLILYVQIGDKKYYWLDDKGFLKKNNDSTWIISGTIPYESPVKLKLGFISPYISKVQFSYSLDSYGNNWTEWSNNSEILLPALKGGKHKLQIRFKSEVTDKIYTVSLNFSVAVPFYKSKLFQASGIIVLLLIFYQIIGQVARKERRRRMLFERLVKKRTKEIEEKTKLLEKQYEQLNELHRKLKQQKEEVDAQNERLRLTNLELRQLSLVAQKTDNSVLILDKKGRIEWWNEGFAKLFSHKFDLNAKNIPSLIKNIRPDVFERIQNFFPENKTVEYTTREILPGGQKELWYKTTITPVFDENGEIHRFVVLDIDISEIKYAEKQIKKQKDALEKQTKVLRKINEEIEEHRLRLEIQHKDMLSSLEYAKKIQSALLPKEDLAQIFPEHFILDRPKEIVSGDFYYLTLKRNKIIFAIADGTGHGVPGAFMSVLGITLLKDAIERQEDELHTFKILNTLRMSIIKALHQESSGLNVRDGLDIALGIIDPHNKILEFSGANIPINIVREKDVLIEIKADRMPIGIHEFMDVPFTYEIVEIMNHDRIYLYTDGYIDQFGGPDNKRFRRNRFKKLLLQIQEYNFEEQKIKLEAELDMWMRDNDQIDDITVLGFDIDLDHLIKLLGS